MERLALRSALPAAYKKPIQRFEDAVLGTLPPRTTSTPPKATREYELAKGALIDMLADLYVKAYPSEAAVSRLSELCDAAKGVLAEADRETSAFIRLRALLATVAKERL